MKEESNLISIMHAYNNGITPDTKPEFEMKFVPSTKNQSTANKDSLKQSLYTEYRNIFMYLTLKKYSCEDIQTINFIDSKSKKCSIIKELYFKNSIQDKSKKRFYIKERLHYPVFITLNRQYEFKITLCYEKDTAEPNDFNLTRFKQRFRFEVGEWYIDITFVKILESKDINAIKEIKDKLFTGVNNYSIINDKQFIWSYVDNIELEVEYNSTSALSIDKINNIKNFIYSIISDNEIKNNLDYGKVITTFSFDDFTTVSNLDEHIKKLSINDTKNSKPNYCEITNSKDIEDFIKYVHYIINPKSRTTPGKTLKSILPNAIEINKKQYFMDVLPNINNFYITDKADGIRSLLYINYNNIIAYDNKLYILTLLGSINSINNAINKTANNAENNSANNASDDAEYNLLLNKYLTDKEKLLFNKNCHYLLECECINGKWYVYDILHFNDKSVTGMPFRDRIKFLHEFTNIYDKIYDIYINHINIKLPSILLKRFIKLDVNNYKNLIRNFYTNIKNKQEYSVDGLILTSSKHSYSNTKFYKWKPTEHMTIDFVAKKCPSNLLGVYPYITKQNHELYILFSGVSLNEYNTFNMTKIKYYDIMFPTHKINYFPIQFSPSDNTMAYLYWHPINDVQNIDGNIIELKYENEWKLVKVRHDRIQDLKDGTYYGNHFRVAELIWRNYSNPLTLDLLCSNIENISKEFYFKTEKSEIHKPIRQFNNMVKLELLKRLNLDKGSNIIDLGAGKGQDILKYKALESVSNVLFVDCNENNLCEIIDRKYGKLFNSLHSSLHSSSQNSSHNSSHNNGAGKLGIYIKNLDLLNNYEQNMLSLKKSHPFLQKINTKLIVCNFAIHYFTNDNQTINNFVDLVDLLLPEGGRFMFTCLNGEKVYNLLNRSKNLEWGDYKKYFIKFVCKNTMKFKGGEGIDILLPFSDEKLFTEHLVNLRVVEKCFKNKKISLEIEANFGDIYLDNFKKYNNEAYNSLDDLDKEYINLLYFAIYYKKPSNNKIKSK